MPQLTRPRPAARARRGLPRRLLAQQRRGLTLIEVLITMTVLAIVGGALLSILTRQQRFYRDAAETVVVRRELRGGASLLPIDLRAVSTVGGDLLEATATRISVRAAIGSGVVCQKSGSTIYLVPLNLSNHTLTSWHSAPQVKDTVFVFNEGSEVGASDDSWWQSPVVSVASSNLACLGSPFIQLADIAKPKIRLDLLASVPADVDVGAVVRITRPVRYSLYQPSASSDWYLGYEEHTGSAWSAIEPITGPLAATSGARFQYFDKGGVLRTPTTDAGRAEISRVGVALRAVGRSDALRARNGAGFQDSLSFKIGIRNFQ